MEIQLQGDSRGILYEGYERDFIQCIFEEGDVSGRNERYEYRCSPELECCGRSCCIPTPAVVPLWLIILLLVLASIFLLSILATLAWLCAKRKPKPKPPKKVVDYRSDVNRLHQRSDRDRTLLLVDGAATTPSTTSAAHHRTISNSGDDDASTSSVIIHQQEDRLVQQHPPSTQALIHEKFVPSPMEETFVHAATPIKVQHRTEADISTADVPRTVDQQPPPTQRAELAYYRPFVPDPMEEMMIASPERSTPTYHHVSELINAKHATVSTIDRPKETRAELIYIRPGFDNVPSY